MNYDTQALIPAPSDPAQRAAWRTSLASWREETKARLRYDDRLYRRPEFDWVTSCFSCAFLMLCDETVYDHRRGRYTSDALLDHGRREFGGYDAVVLWHAYPRIGFDDRNQFDFLRDMPGGLTGLRDLSRTLRAQGVKVFVEYCPWDVGTRREPGSDLDVLVGQVREIEADGIFLDTMTSGAAEFRARLDAARPGVVLEPENMTPLDRIADHHMSWAQYLGDSDAPGVLRNKWLERRHMLHQTRRWDHDHSGELHTAWMNGTGMMIWENVFGSWAGYNARDRSLLRSMLPVQRRFARLFASEQWTPLVETEARDIYATLWEQAGARLWTLVNRSATPVSGPLLTVEHEEDRDYFDLIQGRDLPAPARNGRVTLDGHLPARGVGGLLSLPRAAVTEDFREFLGAQRRLFDRYDPSTTFPAKPVQPQPVRATAKLPSAAPPPVGMVAVAGGDREMEVSFRQRECGVYGNTDYANNFHPGLHTPLLVKRHVSLTPCAVDIAPVTNQAFLQFLQASDYKPAHTENFLKHWRDGRPVAGEEKHPVVYVDLDDARAYARWENKRLPTDAEWQYAMVARALEPGIARVWNWTESECSDGHTRFCMLKGGSEYRALGSDWYADGGPQPPEFAAKFLRMWPGLDRCATIGFRCAVDLRGEAG
jgi:hypothetical protein